LSCESAFLPKFADSDSYDNAGRNPAVLHVVEHYSAKQVKQALKAIIENDQIHDSRSARANIRTFLTKFGESHPTLAQKAKRALK
jgi:hypothetical protein